MGSGRWFWVGNVKHLGKFLGPKHINGSFGMMVLDGSKSMVSLESRVVHRLLAAGIHYCLGLGLGSDMGAAGACGAAGAATWAPQASSRAAPQALRGFAAALTTTSRKTCL